MDSFFHKNLDLVNRAIVDGQFSYAQEICKHIVRKQPDYIDARRQLQIASKAMYAQTRLFFKIVRQMLASIYLVRAFMFRKRSKLLFIEKAICAHPTSKTAWVLMAHTALENESVDMVLFSYEELYVLFPQDSRIALALGNIYLSMRDHQNALKIGQQLLETDCGNGNAMILVEQASLIQLQQKAIMELTID